MQKRLPAIALCLLAFLLLVQLGFPAYTVNVTIKARCGIYSTNETIYVPNTSINGNYSIVFNVTNAGNLPADMQVIAQTNVGATPAFKLSSSAAPYPCSMAPLFLFAVPTGAAALICRSFNYSIGSNAITFNATHYVNSSYYNTTPAKQNSLFFTTNYTSGGTNCNANETVTLIFQSTASFNVTVDGTVTTIMTVAGRPFNVTVINASGGTIVRAVEINGWLPLVIPQTGNSNVSNRAEGIISPITFSSGMGKSQSFTVIPTGGFSGYDATLGNYTTKIEVLDSGGVVLGTIILQVSPAANRDLANPQAPTVIPIVNKAQITYARDYIYRLYDAIIKYNGGPTYNIVLKSDNTSTGIPASIAAAKPIVFNVTVTQPDGTTPIPGANIEVVEKNGFQGWAMNQFTDSNVTNYAYGFANASASGNTIFIVLPTGGVAGQEQNIGDYYFILRARNPASGMEIFSKNISVTNRAYTNTPSNDGGAIPNAASFNYGRDYLYRLYNRIIGWTQ